MIEARQRPTTEVGAVRRFLVSVLTECAYALARASVRLLPSDHPYRAFREEVLAATDDAHRYALGHEWHDAHSGAKAAIVGVVLLGVLLVTAIVLLDVAGVIRVVIHHRVLHG